MVDCTVEKKLLLRCCSNHCCYAALALLSMSQSSFSVVSLLRMHGGLGFVFINAFRRQTSELAENEFAKRSFRKRYASGRLTSANILSSVVAFTRARRHRNDVVSPSHRQQHLKSGCISTRKLIAITAIIANRSIRSDCRHRIAYVHSTKTPLLACTLHLVFAAHAL